jgi:hypothetical protein
MRVVPADDVSSVGYKMGNLLPFLCSVVSVVPAADVTSVGHNMGKSAAVFMFCCDPSIMMVSQSGQDE